MERRDLAVVESSGDFVRRTFGITPAQDAAIQERRARTGNSWSAIVRDLLAKGLDAEADDEAMKARRRKA